MRVELRELVDHLHDVEFALDADRVPVDPATVIDLDVGTVDEQVHAAVRTSTNRLLIGVTTAPRPGSLLSELDVTLAPAALAADDRRMVVVTDPAAAAQQLLDAVAANPRAALALRHLLRKTEQLPVDAGLAAESAVYSMLLAAPEFARWRAARPRRELPHFDRPAVLVERDGDSLHVVIDRPERRNAFSREVRDGLVEAFDLVLADPSIAHVRLTGAGRAFCSGGDLDEFGTVGDVSLAHLIRLERSVGARIDRCRDRVEVRLHGACIGAGIELPSFAARVSARPDTVIRLPELAMGLVPGAGGTVSITRRVGRWRTAYLALGGAPLDAATALSWGLVDELTD